MEEGWRRSPHHIWSPGVDGAGPVAAAVATVPAGDHRPDSPSPSGAGPAASAPAPCCAPSPRTAGRRSPPCARSGNCTLVNPVFGPRSRDDVVGPDNLRFRPRLTLGGANCHRILPGGLRSSTARSTRSCGPAGRLAQDSHEEAESRNSSWTVRLNRAAWAFIFGVFGQV